MLNDAIESVSVNSGDSNIVPMVSDTSPQVDDLVMTYFKVNKYDLNKSEQEQLSKISQYLNDNSKDEMEKLNILRDIKYRLGTPQLGMSNINHIFNYIKLKNAIKDSEIKMKALEQ